MPGTRPGPRCAETTLSMRAKDTGQLAKGRLGACIGNLLCEDCRSAVHEQTCSMVVNPGRALGPHGPNQVQPTLELLAEFAGTRILDASKLADQAEIAEQRHTFLSLGRKASVGKPHEQIQGRRGRR